MPTYLYRCSSCGHEFERFHKITVKARPRCPECGARTERVISGGAGLVFKGSGFYITDYKRAGEPRGEDGAGKGDAAAKAEKPEKAGKADQGERAAGARTSRKEPTARPAKPSRASGAES
ncbi:MAG TPA: FmdB family zinc ribbon protein [Gemmatimonadales bacterium]|nr:FmdB family zinc ribbon protein [Gemmatimonadales bacterium]